MSTLMILTDSALIPKLIICSSQDSGNDPVEKFSTAIRICRSRQYWMYAVD